MGRQCQNQVESCVAKAWISMCICQVFKQAPTFAATCVAPVEKDEQPCSRLVACLVCGPAPEVKSPPIDDGGFEKPPSPGGDRIYGFVGTVLYGFSALLVQKSVVLAKY